MNNGKNGFKILDNDMHFIRAPDVKMKPSEYFKRHCVVSIEPDELIAQNVIQQVGNSQVVFSTDYPHFDSRYPETDKR